MTKQEYIWKQKALELQLKSRAPVFLGLIVAGLLTNFAIVFYCVRLPEVVGVLLLAMPVVWVFGIALVGASFKKRSFIKFGIQCRHCGKWVRSSQIAIATGNCGYCGEPLFD